MEHHRVCIVKAEQFISVYYRHALKLTCVRFAVCDTVRSARAPRPECHLNVMTHEALTRKCGCGAWETLAWPAWRATGMSRAHQVWLLRWAKHQESYCKYLNVTYGILVGKWILMGACHASSLWGSGKLVERDWLGGGCRPPVMAWSHPRQGRVTRYAPFSLSLFFFRTPGYNAADILQGHRSLILS